MKKKYIQPSFEFVLPGILTFGEDSWNVTSKDGTLHDSSSKQNLVVWDDDFEEDDTWGFNGF